MNMKSHVTVNFNRRYRIGLFTVTESVMYHMQNKWQCFGLNATFGVVETTKQ